MRLYELQQKFAHLEELMETADNPDIIRDTLESIDALAEEKALNIVYLMKSLEAEIAMFKDEEDRIARRRRAIENRHASLKDYLAFCVTQSGKDKIKAGTFTIGLQKSPPSLHLWAPDTIPETFMVTSRSLDRSALLTALKNGEDIPGAALLDDKYHIRIR